MTSAGPVFPPESDAYTAAGVAQAEAADPGQSAWVAANAGSGKTKVLIDRVARLLLRRARPDSILCITYTRAAANEMVGRLYSRLGSWSVMKDGDLRAALSRLEGRPEHAFEPADLQNARALFARALETPGGLRIETIHAFCARILRRFPLEAGISPGFAEIEEDEAERLWLAATEEAILELEASEPETLDRLALAGGGFAIDAAAGMVRGSDRSLSALASLDPDERDDTINAALGASGASPTAILQRAMVDELPVDLYRNTAGALAGLGGNDAKFSDLLTGLLNSSDPAERWDAVRGIWCTKALEPRKSNCFTKNAPDFVVDAFAVKDGEGFEVTRLKRIERDWRIAQVAERTRDLAAFAAPLLASYRAAKARRGALDFDDLIHAAGRLLTRPGLSQWVLYKLDGDLTHVLLDEAQDTSPEQWLLVNELTAEFFVGSGAEHAQEPRTLFVVGDEKQSIYSFQGADPDLFLTGRRAFLTRTQGLGVAPDMLMSFRSSPEILGFVDEVFNADAFDGPPFSRAVPEAADVLRHTARRANQPGRVELLPLKPPSIPDEADPWDAPVDLVGETSPKAALARDIALRIKAMIDAGETVWEELPDRSWARRPLTPGDVLILVRSRTGGLFDALIRELKALNLPVAGADRLKLADHIAVQDALNLLRFAVLPEDDLTLAEILRGPFCGLVDDNAYLYPLAHGRDRATLWSRVQASEDPKVQGVASWLSSLLECRHLPPFEILSGALEGETPCGPPGWDMIAQRLGPPARDPVEALLSRALAHDGEAGASLQTFLSAMDRGDAEIKRDLAEADGEIRIMTVHGAKGLQAPIVILPDTTSAPRGGDGGLIDTDGGLPVWPGRKAEDADIVAGARLLADADALREHRRLLYVALTRAQDRLIVCGAWAGGQRSTTGRHDASWYSLCEAAMARLGCAPESEDDTAPTCFGAPVPCLGAAAKPLPGHGALPDWLTRPAAPERRARRTVSPSQLLSEDAPVIDPLGPRPPDRRLRGRLIHSLLERLPHVPQDEQDAAAQAYLARQAGLSQADRSEIVATSLATLRAPGLADVFSPSGRTEVAIVGAGTGWPDGAIINGRVDRLVEIAGRLLIVDIKTDRPPPADPSGVSEAYLLQMATYANVLEAGGKRGDVDCAIVWTDGPRLMHLPREALLASLKRAQSAL